MFRVDVDAASFAFIFLCFIASRRKKNKKKIMFKHTVIWSNERMLRQEFLRSQIFVSLHTQKKCCVCVNIAIVLKCRKWCLAFASITVEFTAHKHNRATAITFPRHLYCGGGRLYGSLWTTTVSNRNAQGVYQASRSKCDRKKTDSIG